MSEALMPCISPADFSRLFSRYKSYFIVVARSYVRDEVVAEDLVADSFIALWERREELLIEPDKIPSYILASVKNRCLNWLRDQRKHDKAYRDMHSTAMRISEARIATLEAANPPTIFAREVDSIIRTELENMPEMMRLIFFASRYQGKTYQEIASLYELTDNQVEFAIKKATKIFQTALKDYYSALFVCLVITQMMA